MDNSARPASGHPHTVIRMGAGVFSVTSTAIDGRSANIDLRRAAIADIERVAYWVSDLHGIGQRKRIDPKARPKKAKHHLRVAHPRPPDSLSPDPLPRPSRQPLAAVM